MAKRFTDSDKWNHAWFRKLSAKMKCAWIYLCDRCDHAGIWIADFEAIGFNIGEPITQSEILTHFQDKIVLIKDDKYLVRAFIEYQYGTLNPTNRVHQSVISKLEKEGAYSFLNRPLNTILSPLLGAKDKEEDKEKDKDKDFEGGPGETLARNEFVYGMCPDPESVKNLKPEKITVFEKCVVADDKIFSIIHQLQILVKEWGVTLKHFKINKDPKLDEMQIGSMLKREDYGFEKTKLAIIGQRYEAETESFKPRSHVSILRLSGKLHFEKMVNLGAQDQEPQKTEPKHPSAKYFSEKECDWCRGLGTILAKWREDPGDLEKFEDFACHACALGKEKAPLRYWQDHHAEKYIPRWEK